MRRLLVSAAWLLSGLAFTASALPPRGPSSQAGEEREIEGRKNWFYGRRVQPDGTIPPRARERAIAAAQRLPLSAFHGGGAFRVESGALVTQPLTVSWTYPVAPPLTDGVGYGFGNTSLRINAIAVHPTNPDLVYIATSFGGIAKSADGGGTWTYLTDGLPSQEITTIVIDTTAPNIIYAGTGDPYYDGRGTSLLGVGIYRSVDAGTTWQQFGGSTFNGVVIEKLLIDAGTSGSTTGTKLVAVTYEPAGLNRALFASSNSGQTWALGASGDTGWDIAADTSAPSTLYLAAASGFYKSVDGGSTYSPVHDNPDGFKGRVSVSNGVVFISVDTGSFSSAQAPLYSYAANGSPPVQGVVFKSIDRGVTWTQLTAANGFCGTQCSYDQYLFVDPGNPNRLFVGGVDASSSTNGGAAWTNYAPFTPPAMKLHSDHHAFTLAPSNPNRLYEGNDGGIWRSDDGGRTWLNKNANLPGALVLGASVSGDGHMVMGAQDNGTSVYNGGAANWVSWKGGDGGFAKIDAGNSQNMYTTYVVPVTVVPASQPCLPCKSTNGGASVTDITPPGANSETSDFYPPLFMMPENSQYLLIGFQSVWRSVNGGGLWSVIGNLRLQDNTNVTALAAASSSPDTIYVATERNKVYVTNNASAGAGAAWTAAFAGLPPGQTVTALAVHPQSPGTVYAALSQYGTPAAPELHIFKTTNSGASWVGVSTGLPDAPFNDILIDSAAPSNLFAASDVGVFNSIDGGNTWTRSSLGMPMGLIVNSLSLNTGTRQLLAGTFGRGVYSLVLPPVPQSPAGLAGAAQGTSSITWTWTAAAAAFNVQAYGLYYATSPAVLVGSVTAPAFTWSGLSINTTYALQVTATNGIGESLNSGTAFAVTLASPPISPIVSGVTQSSVVFNWGANGDPPGTTYLAQISTNSGFTGLIASSQTLNLSTTFFGLVPGTTYYPRVQAFNFAGVPTDFAVAGATLTLPGPPAPTNVQFVQVSTYSLSATWDLVSGNFYTMALSTNAAFNPVVSSGTGVLNQNTTAYLVVPGFYYFTVKISTNPDTSYSAAISTFVGTSLGSSTTIVVSTYAAAALTLNPPTGPITLTFPAGSLGPVANAVTVTIPVLIPGASGTMAPLGPAIDISLANPVAHFSQAVSLSMAVPSLPAGTNVANVRFAYADPTGAWIEEPDASYNAGTGVVSGVIWHNTVHAAVVVASAANLAHVKVFPNPVNFAAAARGTIKFTGLSAAPTIRIYDLAGERVIAIPPATTAGDLNDGTSGTAEWNGLNSAGSPVARGTYIYVITDPAGHKATGKIGVQR